MQDRTKSLNGLVASHVSGLLRKAIEEFGQTVPQSRSFSGGQVPDGVVPAIVSDTPQVDEAIETNHAGSDDGSPIITANLDGSGGRTGGAHDERSE
jgi:hypothetical protein